VSSGADEVLVVDDNRSFLEAAREVLERASFSVHTAETAAEARAFLSRSPPCEAAPSPRFIVLDYHLEDAEAPTVLRWLREIEGRPRVPVLVVSLVHHPEEEALARAEGADAYAVKPTRIASLEEILLGFWREHVSCESGDGD
jgi:DNA-binding response OmpR family regulator